MGLNETVARQKLSGWTDTSVCARIRIASARMTPVCTYRTEGRMMDIHEELTGIITTLVEQLTTLVTENQVLAQWRLLLQQYTHIRWCIWFAQGKYHVEVIGPPDPAVNTPPRYAHVQGSDLAATIQQAVPLIAEANIERRRFPIHPMVYDMVVYIFEHLNGAVSRDALAVAFGDQMSQRQVTHFVGALETLGLTSPAARHTVPNRPRRMLVQNVTEVLQVLAYHPEVTFHAQDGRLIFGPQTQGQGQENVAYVPE